MMHLYRLKLHCDWAFVVAPDVATALRLLDTPRWAVLYEVVEYPLDTAYVLPGDGDDHPVPITPRRAPIHATF